MNHQETTMNILESLKSMGVFEAPNYVLQTAVLCSSKEELFHLRP